MEYEALKDKVIPDAWRVEAIDYENEGVAYITIFLEPNAEERAKEFVAFQTDGRIG